MKSIAMSESVQLTEETKEQLTKGVKEALAETTSKSKMTKFTAIDMWNRQRNSRSASSMVRKWNLN